MKFFGPHRPERVLLRRNTLYIQARSSMARVMEVNGKECQVEGEAKVV